MKMVKKLVLTALVGFSVAQAFAQAQYPTKTISVVVPFAPGGGIDLAARAIAPALSSRLGVAVIVEQRLGAGGNIGINSVVNATPDGYTLLFTSNGIAIEPVIKLNPAYDPRKDLRAISLATQGVLGVFVSPQLPINSLQEFIAYAKANPGKLNFAHPGIGAFTHLTGERLKLVAGIDVVSVPFTGTPQALQSTMANETQVTITEPGSTKGLWQSGKIKLLAVTSLQRNAATAEIPTVAEGGFPGFEAIFWGGFFAPIRTPDSIVSRLDTELAAILANPEMRQKITALGFSPVGMRTDDFKRKLASEIEQFEDVIRKARIPRS